MLSFHTQSLVFSLRLPEIRRCKRFLESPQNSVRKTPEELKFDEKINEDVEKLIIWTFTDSVELPAQFINHSSCKSIMIWLRG